MLNNINDDGTDSIEKISCIVVYAVSLMGNTPYVVRDVEEANHIIVKLAAAGYQVYYLDYQVPKNFTGWYFPKPLKAIEFSIN